MTGGYSLSTRCLWFQHTATGLGYNDSPIRQALERWSVKADQLAAPPDPVLPLGRPIGKPVLPNQGPHLPRRLCRKWITREKPHHAGLVAQEPLLCIDDPQVLAPGAERSEPQVPFKTRLVRRVDPRRLRRVLGLVAEGVGAPGLAVQCSLKFDFVPLVRHHREQSVAVGNAKRFQRLDRPPKHAAFQPIGVTIEARR